MITWSEIWGFCCWGFFCVLASLVSKTFFLFCFVLRLWEKLLPMLDFFFPIKPAFMQQWMRWWQSTLCGRKTALLIRILGSKFKTVSLLFGELYMIQLILPVQTQPLTRCVIETHTHTLIPSRKPSQISRWFLLLIVEATPRKSCKKAVKTINETIMYPAMAVFAAA